MLGFYRSDLLFRRAAFFLGAQHDGGAVSIVGANVGAHVAARFLETYPDVGLNVFQQVAQVDGAVGVWERAGDQDLALAVCHVATDSLRFNIVEKSKGGIVAGSAAAFIQWDGIKGFEKRENDEIKVSSRESVTAR